MSVDGVFNLTNIDRWFLVQIEEIVRLEEQVAQLGLAGLNADFFASIKNVKGFADARLANYLECEKSKSFANYGNNINYTQFINGLILVRQNLLRILLICTPLMKKSVSRIQIKTNLK